MIYGKQNETSIVAHAIVNKDNPRTRIRFKKNMPMVQTEMKASYPWESLYNTA